MKIELWGKEVNLDVKEELFLSEEERTAQLELLGEGCEHGWFDSSYQDPSTKKAAQLHYYKFLPKTEPPKGIVIFMHGIQGHSGRAVAMKDGRNVNTRLMASEYTKRGYALYALDMLGHGYSEGIRFYVPKYQVNRDDLDHFARFVANQHPGTPFFLAGESYGSCLALHVAGEWQKQESTPKTFAGCAITASAIIGDLPPKPVVWTLRYFVAPLFPLWVPFFMPNTVSADRIWTDSEVREWYTNPRRMESDMEGGGRPFRLGTALSLLTATEDVRAKVIPGLKTPFCACHGVDDAAVPIASVDFLEKHAATPEDARSVLRQANTKHDMLAEPNASETLDFILQFMEDRIQKHSTSNK